MLSYVLILPIEIGDIISTSNFACNKDWYSFLEFYVCQTVLASLSNFDTKIKHVNLFKYLGSVVTAHGKCDTLIRI